MHKRILAVESKLHDIPPDSFPTTTKYPAVSVFGSIPRTQFYQKITYEPPPPNKATSADALREVDRARTLESKVRVWLTLIDNGRTKYTLEGHRHRGRAQAR